MSVYEVWREVFRITEWRDGAVYRTISEGHRWVDHGVSPPRGYIYAPPSEDPPNTAMTIRRKA